MFKKSTSIIILVALIFANIFVWLRVATTTSQHNMLEVTFLDVGQGDAIFIEAPNGNQILIDTGPTDVVIRKLSEILPYYDRHIDIVLTTHPDLDHIGGAPAVFNRYKIGTYIFYENAPMSDAIERINESIYNNNIATGRVRAGDRIVLDAARSIYLDVLWPSDAYVTDDKNDMSIITKLVYGESDVLLTGDASSKIERILLSEYADDAGGTYLQSDILKLGHHGSKTSSAEAFLKSIMPDFAIVSAGLNNRYRHPSAEVVERLERMGFPIIKTTDRGSVIFRTDGATWWRD